MRLETETENMPENRFQHIGEGSPVTKEQALRLLSIKNLSPEYFRLLSQACESARRRYGQKGYIFVQIGLDSSPCRRNCRFCSIARCNHENGERKETSLEEILSAVKAIDFTKVTALFLMTTAEYDPEHFLQIGRAVREHIPEHIALVANTDDFDAAYGRKLRQAGFTGVYHVVRLREGEDTDVASEVRVATLDAAQAAGLRLYYCVEPIGPEHSYEELVTEMMRAREYHVDVMAVMRRVNVPNTKFEAKGMIDDYEFAKIAAVTQLVVMPEVSMNVHEPSLVAMLGGVNQLYAEIGVNPREMSRKTEHGRGYSVNEAAQMLRNVGYLPCIERQPQKNAE